MAIQLDVQLADDLAEALEEPPSSKQLKLWAQAAWQGELEEKPVISLRIISSAESQQLNHDYRNKNKPTNVLSFPMQMELQMELQTELETELQMEPDETLPQLEELQHFSMLGDLAICAEVVEQEALQQNKPRLAHWAHMVVHGMLHLQDFDHIEDAEAVQMEQLETVIMQQLGFADPYQLTVSDSVESAATESSSTSDNTAKASPDKANSSKTRPIESSMTESKHE